MNTSSTARRPYKTRLQYYQEILSYCKISPKGLNYLMQATENTNSNTFHGLFDPLVVNKYIKKNDGNVFSNTYGITPKGLMWLDHVEIVVSGLKELEGEMSYVTFADITVNNDRIDKMMKKK